MLLPVTEQRRFIDAMQAVAPGRGFLHYSYCATSPLPWKKHDLAAKREEWTPAQLPARQRVAVHAAGWVTLSRGRLCPPQTSIRQEHRCSWTPLHLGALIAKGGRPPGGPLRNQGVKK